MARRRRVRFLRNRVKPDMAWIVGEQGSQAIANADGEFFSAIQMFGFAQIDQDDSLIAQDKSDWVIKRVILDLYASCNLDGLLVTDTMRLANYALVTADSARMAIDNDEDVQIMSDVFYNSVARTLRTDTAPAYHPHGLPVAQSTPIADAGVLSQSSNSAGIDALGYFPMFAQWGPACLRWDFTTNCGLRENQGLYLCRSDAAAPGAYDWVEGDSHVATWAFRVLLQKRRT